MFYYRNNYDMGKLTHVPHRNLIDISALSEEAQEEIHSKIEADRRQVRTHTIKSQIDRLQEELDTLQ